MKARRPSAPAHVDTLRAVDSGARKRKNAVRTVGTTTIARAIRISGKNAWAAPRAAGFAAIAPACATTIAVRIRTYGTRYRRIGAKARRRRARYDVKPTRTGGITKNHFIVPSGIRAVPFGAVHRCATTSRIEYREDVKIQAIRKAIPKADRNGAFAGRLSRPRSMKGRTRRKITKSEEHTSELQSRNDISYA